MKVILTKGYSEMSAKAADILETQIKTKPNSFLVLASGKTPKKLYSLLTKAKLDFSKAKVFNLDELYNTNKYQNYFQKNLLSKINLKKSNIHLINGKTKNPEKECKSYESKLKKNRPDLTLLGVAANGHIAFNEPGSLKSTKTRLVDLAPETIKKNKAKQGLTIGISTILRSRKILLLASGKNKAKALHALIKGPQTSKWPVSFLKQHKNLTVIIDKAAGSLL